jgi:hypothetical protein
MRTTVLMLASTLAFGPVCALAAEPYAGVSGDAYAYQRAAGGGSGYSYRSETSERGGAVVGAPVGGQVNCQGYCLPPGYVIEDPNRPRVPPAQYEESRGYVGEPVYQEAPRAYVGEPVYHDDQGGYVGEPVYHDEGGARTGGPLYAGEDRYGARRTYEERGGYSWGYEERVGYERHETGWDDRRYDDWGRERCRQRWDAQGRMVESCGEIRLGDSFFWGGGGVGPEYIDGGGGGGGGGAYAEAGAGASAYASARASVGVSIRIGGRGGHKGGHGGKGGCGKCGGH